jgi:hypothetical protein
VNAFPSVPPIAFAGDWRRPYMDAIKRAFPALDQGGVRDSLARALGRARDPGAASTALSDEADRLGLTDKARRDVTTLVIALAKQAVMESEV